MKTYILMTTFVHCIHQVSTSFFSCLVRLLSNERPKERVSSHRLSHFLFYKIQKMYAGSLRGQHSRPLIFVIYIHMYVYVHITKVRTLSGEVVSMIP